ncbi:MAG: ComEC/Rec2 family competence protein [Rothia sp. (in: high G+C Gram-positive bacteria)]|nr:ComEC/Rec2 family competence protein [Rothia sp. (in: high G+C Gram-positive bacteria)]
MGNIQQRILAWWKSDREKQDHQRFQRTVKDFRLIFPALFTWTLTYYVMNGSLTAVWCLQLLGVMVVIASVSAYCASQRRASSSISSALSQQLFLSVLCVFTQFLVLLFGGYFHLPEVMAVSADDQVMVSGTVQSARPINDRVRLLKMDANSLKTPSEQHIFPAEVTLFSAEKIVAGEHIAVTGKLSQKNSEIRMKPVGEIQHFSTDGTSSLVTLKEQAQKSALSAMNADSAALLLGLSYGDDSSMTPATQSAFKIAGLTHLTAVSGANMSLIFMLIFRTGLCCGMNRKMLIIGGVGGTFGYGLLVGLDGSVIRAWAMGLLGAVALLRGSGKSNIPLLCCCVLVLLAIRPHLCHDLGFILSVVATAALLILGPALVQLMSLWMPIFCAELLAMTVSATLWTTPFIVMLSHMLTPYGVLANVLATPVVFPITLLGLIFLATQAFHWQLLEQLVLIPSAISTEWLLGVAHWIEKLPYSAVPLPDSPTTQLLSFLIVVVISGLIFGLHYRLVQAPQSIYTRQVHHGAA